MASHAARVGSLSWNGHILSRDASSIQRFKSDSRLDGLHVEHFCPFSGSRSGDIQHHDVRVAEHHLCTLAAHTWEVGGMHWSPDGRCLASGGGDGVVCVCVWTRVQEGQGAIHNWSEHQGDVKVRIKVPRNIRVYLGQHHA